MKRTTRLSILCVWTFCVWTWPSPSPAVFSLAFSKLASTAFESTSTQWSNPGDDDQISIPLGFNFPFKGSTYTSVELSSNGVVHFSSSASVDYSNTDFPISPSPSILPYWDDMDPSSGGTIRYGSSGSSPEQRLVIEFLDVPFYNSSTTCQFQVVLYETGAIRFRYGAGTQCDGSSATIGVQENNSDFSRYSFKNTALDTAGYPDLVFAPVDMSVTLATQVVSDPFNNSTNPKAIPGAVVEYTATLNNDNLGSPDDNTFVYTAPIPAETALIVSGSNIAGYNCDTAADLIHGSPSSGLSCPSGAITYSNDGGSSWTYTPSPDASGADAFITHMKISLNGRFSGSLPSSPSSATVSYRVKIR